MSDLELIRQVNRIEEEVKNLDKPEIGGMSFIESEELSGSVASVTFSSISQDFNHLSLFLQARTDAVAELDSVLIRFNADSGNNYDRQFLRGNNVTASASVGRAISFILGGLCEAANSRASNFSLQNTFIPGYAKTDREKWALTRSGVFGDVSADADLFIDFHLGRWRDTSAITSIVLTPNTGTNFVTGSIFQLYGLL